MADSYQEYYDRINLALNLNNTKNEFEQNIQSNHILEHEQHLIKRQNILLSHIIPTESDKIIAMKMMKIFYARIAKYKKSLLNSSINYIMFITNITSEIFSSVKNSQDQLTLGVYKHFYNLTLDKLNSMGQNIARSHLYPKISTIYREATRDIYSFMPNKFIDDLLNSKEE